jgi:nucleotide-binding universal stress UspA family protein
LSGNTIGASDAKRLLRWHSLPQDVQSTDFSQASDIALQYAIDMAQRCSAQTHLLHVVDDLSFGATRTAAGYVPAAPELQQALVRGASFQLANAA